MRRMRNPGQTELFDAWIGHLPARTREKWFSGWEGLFRAAVLEQLPVEALSKHFHESLGRPTKELYSMAGLVVLQDFNDWDTATAVTAYESHQNVRFALGLGPGVSELSVRTLERYRRRLIEDDVAMAVFTGVTQKLAALMGLEVKRQRLDSTHVFSNMASFGRTQLMGVAIKRFLNQVQRHASEDYEALPAVLRERYAPPRNRLFGDRALDAEGRSRLRRQVAEDMEHLVARFQDHEAHRRRDTYKQMARIFFEQCEVVEDTVRIRRHPGGATLQNPSDPDATYDGKKGPGYQVQIAETCGAANAQQLVTAVLPQTAVESDTTAFPHVLDQLEANGLLPEELTADSLYGTDDNMQEAHAREVALISPVKKGREKAALTTEDMALARFEYDDKQESVIRCPAGHAPARSAYDAAKGRTETFMRAAYCEACPHRPNCPARKTRKSKGHYRVYSEPRKVRLTRRRIAEQSDEFKARYRIRAGIEGTNSGLKRRMGLGRLRVRGRPRVFIAIIFKVMGWNILRASACAKVRDYVRRALASRLSSPRARQSPLWKALLGASRRLRRQCNDLFPILTPNAHAA